MFFLCGGGRGEFKPASSALEPVLGSPGEITCFPRLKSDSKRRDLSIFPHIDDIYIYNYIYIYYLEAFCKNQDILPSGKLT